MARISQLMIVLMVLSTVTACGDAGASMGSSKSSADEANGYGGSGGNGADDNEWPQEPGAASEDVSAQADYGPPPDPESEFNFDLKAPQASEHYVFIAATERDSLVRITADESLEIRLIPVGGRPTTVATLADQDVALVINSGTYDFSVVRSSQAADVVTTLDILPYVNTIAVSPDGKYAIVYYSDAAAQPEDPVGDFQTVAVVNVQEGKEEVLQVSTGFHVTGIAFHESQPIAYLTTDDGVALIELDGVSQGDITPIVNVAHNPLEDPAMREVLITASGDYAVVRNLALPQLTVVDMVTEEKTLVEVAGLPTDVDLIPGTNRFLAVLREQGLAYVVDLDGVLAGDEEAVVEIDISGSLAGAAVVTRDGLRAVLYTTVGGIKAVAVLELAEAGYPWQSYSVQKGVLAVAVSQEGATALVFHEAEPVAADSSGLDKTIAAAQGFTLFNLDSGYRKLIQTDHHWADYLFVTDKKGKDDKAYVLTPDPYDILHSVQQIDLTSYIVDTLPIASSPTSMVYVPTSRKVAVAQDHLNGRLTFIDVDSGDQYSVTGYELNGLIH
jgi:hypothetical protein